MIASIILRTHRQGTRIGFVERPMERGSQGGEAESAISDAMPKMLTAARCSIFYDHEDEVGSFEVGDGRSLRDVKAALSGLIGFAATAMAMTRDLLVLFMSVRS